MTDARPEGDRPEGHPYDGARVAATEAEWRRIWSERKTFRAPDPGPRDSTFFCLDMFPYPSGDGLHVGHAVGFIASDIVARYKRMKGFNVLHPTGWDAFGLPAERHAMKTGRHPAETVRINSANYRRQMELIGLSIDWDRAFSTTDPGFYKHTQSMFIDFYEAWFDPEARRARPISELPIPEAVAAEGEAAVAAYRDARRLAYFDEAVVNFCPELGTVVANEEVMADGRTEQGYEVVRRRQRQVMMRISAFAERLIDGLEDLDWPEAIKEMQRNWIGRGVGHVLSFDTDAGPLPVYTTRADTLPGTTFLVVAPEHPMMDALTADDRRAEVEAYVRSALQKSELSRKRSTEKTGVATGALARNPLTGEAVPVFVSDYVLLESGTGAVMGVPAHDQRDFDFARLKGLDIVPVLAPEGQDGAEIAEGDTAWTGDGIALPFDLPVYAERGLAGMRAGPFAEALCGHLVEAGIAEPSVQFRMRDWIFSRQRYWGEPIPLIHWDDGSVEPVDRADLPVELPALDDYRPSPDGAPPLARAEGWVAVTDPATGRTGRRETLTMPQWAGSCWYPLRFMDPGNPDRAVDPALERRWGPVDLYVGGAEHATLHLLYARFWYMALSDLGRIETAEPFGTLVNQGMLLAHTFRTARGVLVPADEVERRADGEYYVAAGSAHHDSAEADMPLERVKAKMSKSLRNVVTPDEVVERHGADAYRVCMMFMGPVDQLREWEDGKAAAAAKFLRRVWRFVTANRETGIRDTVPEADEAPEVTRTVEEAVATIEGDIEALRLNTAIAALMKCLNAIGDAEVSRRTLEALVLALSPFAPFMCEELWRRMGHEESLARAPWPEVDPARHAGPESVTLVVTVNGKKRAELEVPAGSDDAELEALAREALGYAGGARAIVVRDKASGRPKLVNVIARA